LQYITLGQAALADVIVYRIYTYQNKAGLRAADDQVWQMMLASRLIDEIKTDEIAAKPDRATAVQR
jgi:hypothetical protein